MTKKQSSSNRRRKAQHPLLPEALLQLPIERLPLEAELLSRCREHEIATVADLLDTPRTAFAKKGWVGPLGMVSLRTALDAVLQVGLAQVAETPEVEGADWPALQAEILAAVGEPAAAVLRRLLGIDAPCLTIAELQQQGPHDARALETMLDEARTRLHEHLPKIVCKLRHEIGLELRALGDVVDGSHFAVGSLLQAIAAGTGDPRIALRLVSFCFPHDYHLYRDMLVGLPPRRFRRLVRQLRKLVNPQRLPLSIDTLLGELATEQVDAPRALVVHLLRSELRISIENGADGEVAVPDPRSPSARLADLLAEMGQPTMLEDLVFAYRERFRRASRSTIDQRLRRDPAFVMVGPDCWSLRTWRTRELEVVMPLVDKVARRICTEGGKRNIAHLLAEDTPDDRTIWLVLDRLAHDPRVRLLGRGELCPATHTRSQVLDQLLQDFRRAAGDCVTSLFLSNQPENRRRLVKRLLQENRLFVFPSEDRVDVLTNYPFNKERMARLIQLVGQQLDQRTGYAQTTAIKAAVDRTDLGGSWLSPMLLADILRRHSPFEVLPGGLIGRADLGLGASLMRTVRQALREAGEPISIDDIFRARPDLIEFSACLRELLCTDPMVQTPDGSHFSLA